MGSTDQKFVFRFSDLDTPAQRQYIRDSLRPEVKLQLKEETLEQWGGKGCKIEKMFRIPGFENDRGYS